MSSALHVFARAHTDPPSSNLYKKPPVRLFVQRLWYVPRTMLLLVILFATDHEQILVYGTDIVSVKKKPCWRNNRALNDLSQSINVSSTQQLVVLRTQ